MTNRRWKCMPAERILDDVQELHERWGFEVLGSGDDRLGSLEAKRFSIQNRCEGLLRREEAISRSWIDPGHETGTGDSANSASVRKARSCTGATVR